MTTISPPDRAGPATACAHCGLPVPTALLRPDGEHSFCCGGCATAYAIIHDGGLDRYYDLPERRSAAVAPSGKSFEEFDHPAFHALYVRTRPDGTAETELYLDGVHCASCVWLVERVPLLVPGVLRAELEVGRALAHVAWNPASTSLSAIARFLDTLGYRPHPFRAQRVEERRRAEDRTAMLRIGVAGALAGNVMMLAVALYSGWFAGMEPAFVRYFRWLSLLLTAPVLIWPGRVFFQGAFASFRTRRLHMDLPIAIALGAGFVRGTMNTVTDTGPIYFDGVAMLVFLLLVGRFLQQRAQRAATDATSLLHGLTPSVARMVEGEAIREVPGRGAPAGRAGRGARRRDLPGRRDGGGGRVPRGPLTPDRRIAAGRRLAGGEGLGRHRQPGGGAPGDGDAELARRAASAGSCARWRRARAAARASSCWPTGWRGGSWRWSCSWPR